VPLFLGLRELLELFIFERVSPRLRRLSRVASDLPLPPPSPLLDDLVLGSGFSPFTRRCSPRAFSRRYPAPPVFVVDDLFSPHLAARISRLCKIRSYVPDSPAFLLFLSFLDLCHTAGCVFFVSPLFYRILRTLFFLFFSPSSPAPPSRALAPLAKKACFAFSFALFRFGFPRKLSLMSASSFDHFFSLSREET